MAPQANISLSQYSTMRLGGTAQYLVEVRSREDLQAALAWTKEHSLPAIVVGGGSNIVWRDSGFQGLVIVNKLLGYEDVTDGDTHTITIAAGEVWDDVVRRSVEAGLTGIEALSLIPGTAGATPVQNVGAYGQEIAQTLVSVEVLDTETGEFHSISNEGCAFAYRQSRFQTDFREKYWIVGLTLRLRAGNPEPPFYNAVQQYFDAHNITEPITPQILRDAVIAIRSSKLPDVAEVANNGSFFGNPIIDSEKLAEFLAANPDAPHWPTPDGGGKIPAAWLLEQCGFKDYHDDATGMATWATQPLVLVNEHASSTSDLIAFRDMLVSTVQEKFGITLHQEPELLP